MASENYLLVITLRGIRNPVITRTLSVPRTTRFHKFHKALQIAFGWTSTHLYKFDVLEPPPADRRRREFGTTRVTLEEIPDPLMDFNPEPSMKSTEVTLQQVLDNPQYNGCPVEYHYDFGDGWEHTIEVVGTEGGNGVIKCVDGKGHGVAEDCGGTAGWQSLKSIYRKVLQAEDREEAIRNLTMGEKNRMRWFEQGCSNGVSSGLDPDHWSTDDVNSLLATEL